jgi:enoyl-CoA hydratase
MSSDPRPTSDTTPTLTLSRRGYTAILTLSRSPANALNHTLLTELQKQLAQLCADAEVRALVLTGEGRFFSAGLDLHEVFDYPPALAQAFTRTFDDVFTLLFSLELPVVAAINGHAIAGGAVLAATADFRLMSDGDAKLGLSEIKVGVPFPTSALEPVRFAWAGPHLAELLYRGSSYGPRHALSYRLIDEVVPAAELLERALALAAELGSRPKVAFASTKRALRREALCRMAAARAGGDDPLWTLWRTEEVLAAMATYRAGVGNKRPPATR